MPLPHFLLMILAVLFAGLVTLLLSFAVGLPEVAVILVLLSAAALAHLGHRIRHDHDG